MHRFQYCSSATQSNLRPGERITWQTLPAGGYKKPKESNSCYLLYLCRFRIVVTSVVILILAILWRYQESDNVRLVMDSVTGHFTVMRERVISLGTPLQNFVQKIYQRDKSWHREMILCNDEESLVCASPRENCGHTSKPEKRIHEISLFLFSFIFAFYLGSIFNKNII